MYDGTDINFAKCIFRVSMPHPPQQIRFCTSRDGTRIAYATCGSGPTLVRAGNWVTHLELDWDNPIWRPWLSVLMRRHSLVRYDFSAVQACLIGRECNFHSRTSLMILKQS
jgi:hypothetical protein